jgi:hypothetical protein
MEQPSTIKISANLNCDNDAPPITFTRYLYVKDEVELALVTSLLDKKEKAIFWAYELYYSGFEKELFNHLWKIYFDFYYTLNPSFYDYFVKKCKEWGKMSPGIERDKIIIIIVSDLLIRPHNLDVFLLREITQNFAIDLPENNNDNNNNNNKFIQIKHWFLCKEYLNIAEFILHKCNDDALGELLDFIACYFKESTPTKKMVEHKINKNINIVKINKRHMMLAYVMMQFSIIENIKMGKKLYIIVDDADAKKYETIYSDYNSSFYPYKILPKVYLHGIDEENYLCLFNLQRNSINLSDAYLRHWEYYASYSPVWSNRIKQFQGTINHILKKIDFPDDDLFEEFYDSYNYETDEQKPETTNKSIQPIKSGKTWNDFYETHKKNGLYIPEAEFLEEMGTINA